MIAVGEDPILLDRFLGRGEPGAALGLAGREGAHHGQPAIITQTRPKAVEFRLIRQPFGLDLGHDRERPVEEGELALSVELNRARSHPVGQLALRFLMVRQLDAGVLQILDVDGRIGGFNFQWAWASGHVVGHALKGFICKQ